MKKILLKIFAVFTVVIMLFPSVAKLEHHHNHFTHPDDTLFTREHSHDCPICKFEFSSFLEQKSASIPEKPIKHQDKNYVIIVFKVYLPSLYSFSLRAPPAIIA